MGKAGQDEDLEDKPKKAAGADQGKGKNEGKDKGKGKLKAAAEKAGPKTSNQDEDLEDEMEWAVAAAKNAIKKVSAWGKDKKAAGAKKFAELKADAEKAVKAAAEKAGQDED